jgi:hypothetical protein
MSYTLAEARLRKALIPRLVGGSRMRNRYSRKFFGPDQENTRHRRQFADIPVDHSEQRDDRGLVGGDGVEVAHRKRIVWEFLRWFAFVPRVLSSPMLVHRSSSPRLTKSNAFFDRVSYMGRTGALHGFQNLQDRSDSRTFYQSALTGRVQSFDQ